MRLIRAVGASIAIFIFALVGLASPASAVDYWTQLASGLTSSGRHVYQDPSLILLSSQQIQALEQQIVQSDKPVYVVVVDQAKAGQDTTGYPAAMHAALGHSGAYAVVGAKTFRASAFNVPNRMVAQAVPQIASSVGASAKARGATGPDFQLVKEWVGGVTGLDWSTATSPQTAPASGSGPVTVPRQASSGLSTGTVIGLVCGTLAIIILIVFLIMRRRRRSDEMEGAQYVDSVDRLYGGAAQRLSATSRKTLSHGHTPVPSETRTTVNNHYFGGGYSNGTYYGPGWYPMSDPFWNYLMWDSLLDHHDRDVYHDGYRDAQHDAATRDDTGSANSGYVPDTPSSDVGTSGYGSGYAGGTDWGKSSDDSSSSSTGSSWSTSSSSDTGSSGYSSDSSSSWSAPDTSSSSFDSGSSGGTDF